MTHPLTADALEALQRLPIDLGACRLEGGRPLDEATARELAAAGIVRLSPRPVDGLVYFELTELGALVVFWSARSTTVSMDEFVASLPRLVREIELLTRREG